MNFAKLKRGLFNLWVLMIPRIATLKKYFYYSQPKISCTTTAH